MPPVRLLDKEEKKEKRRQRWKTMPPSKLLEKMITWMIVIGFTLFCGGYLYLVLAVLQGYNLPSQIWVAVIGFALIFLAFFGLHIFRRFFGHRR